MSSAILKITAVFFAVASIISCKKETQTVTVNNPVYSLRGNGSGKQEVPTNPSTATGTITGTYNKETNAMAFTITWTGLVGGNPTAAHFHGASDPGVSAPVIMPLASFPATTSGTFTGTATLTDAQETDFVNGLWYYNIHNATYPGGEVRGQIILTQ